MLHYSLCTFYLCELAINADSHKIHHKLITPPTSLATHLNGAFTLDEPPTKHGLETAVSKVRVDSAQLLLDIFLKEQTS